MISYLKIASYLYLEILIDEIKMSLQNVRKNIRRIREKGTMARKLCGTKVKQIRINVGH